MGEEKMEREDGDEAKVSKIFQAILDPRMSWQKKLLEWVTWLVPEGMSSARRKRKFVYITNCRLSALILLIKDYNLKIQKRNNTNLKNKTKNKTIQI